MTMAEKRQGKARLLAQIPELQEAVAADLGVPIGPTLEAALGAAIESALATEYTELGRARGTGREACPTFTLTAGRAGHLKVLAAVLYLLPESEQAAAAVTLREFEMWEERCLR
jgi:hypothetical protein